MSAPMSIIGYYLRSREMADDLDDVLDSVLRIEDKLDLIAAALKRIEAKLDRAS